MTLVPFCQFCDVVEEHYICFVAVNGKGVRPNFLTSIFHFFMYLHVKKELNWFVGTLTELDGMKDGPIKHGSSSSKSLLQVLQV
jgi:ubiquitin carboxyl-terminal hydrolase L3